MATCMNIFYHPVISPQIIDRNDTGIALTHSPRSSFSINSRYTLLIYSFSADRSRSRSFFCRCVSMARNANHLEKMSSIDAQLRLLAPKKVSEDDKLVEFDALLLDSFLDTVQDLHGPEIRQTVCIIYQ